MKLYLPTNPLWYFAVLVIIVPFFVLRVIEPAWIVRLVFIAMLYLGGFIICLHSALVAHKTINENTPFIQKYGKKMG